MHQRVILFLIRLMISHLFFANDSLVFIQASRDAAQTVQSTLLLYEAVTGQKVNFQKSVITFSPCVDEDIRASIFSVLGLDRTQSHDRYIGLSLVVGRSYR